MGDGKRGGGLAGAGRAVEEHVWALQSNKSINNIEDIIHPKKILRRLKNDVNNNLGFFEIERSVVKM